ncbi:MAG: hypothetical protein M0Z94_13900, partial [Dehalococcoidales bacterium]|nr:hypothetical protein [Dehalococcoidales bacterium]
KGGLTAVYAEDLSINGILNGIMAKRCYATTGARMLLHLEGEGRPMGGTYRTHDKPRITARVVGTASLEVVELYRGLEKVYEHDLGLRPSPRRVRITWDGASRETSYSGIIWDGGLRVGNGSIAAVERIRFDSPRSYVADVGPSGLTWHAVTCGYQSGVVLDLEGDADTDLVLSLACALVARPAFAGKGGRTPKRTAYAPAERLTFRCRLGDLAEGPKELEIGALNRRVVLSLVPDKGTGAREVAFTHVDAEPAAGINPYWLRVVQSDMEMAWSSPVFVGYLGE